MTDELFSLRGLGRALTPADRILSATIFSAGLLGFLGLRAGAPVPREALVFVDAARVATLPLDRVAEIEVSGTLSPVRILTGEGRVRVTRSGCPNQICVAMGEKRRSGEIIVCVPNALVVRLVGEFDASAPDAITR